MLKKPAARGLLCLCNPAENRFSSTLTVLSLSFSLSLSQLLLRDPTHGWKSCRSGEGEKYPVQGWNPNTLFCSVKS